MKIISMTELNKSDFKTKQGYATYKQNKNKLNLSYQTIEIEMINLDKYLNENYSEDDLCNIVEQKKVLLNDFLLKYLMENMYTKVIDILVANQYCHYTLMIAICKFTDNVDLYIKYQYSNTIFEEHDAFEYLFYSICYKNEPSELSKYILENYSCEPGGRTAFHNLWITDKKHYECVEYMIDLLKLSTNNIQIDRYLVGSLPDDDIARIIKKLIENELSIHIKTNYVFVKEYLAYTFSYDIDEDILLLIINKFDINLNDFNFYELYGIIPNLLDRNQHKILQQLILNTSNISTKIKFLIIKQLEQSEKADVLTINLYIDQYFYDNKFDIYNHMINTCQHMHTFLYFVENAQVEPNINLIIKNYNIDIVKWMFDQGYRLDKTISYKEYTFEVLNIILEYDCLDCNYDRIKDEYKNICQSIFIINNLTFKIDIIKKLIELSDAKIIDLHFGSHIVLSKAIIYENFDIAQLLLDNDFILTNKEDIIFDAKILKKDSILDFLLNIE